LDHKHTIRTRSHELVAERVSREQINRLQGMTDDGKPLGHGDKDRLFPNGEPIYGRRLVYPHNRQENLWIVMGGVELWEIRAEMQREIQKAPPMAAANVTVERSRFSNDRGSGWYWQHSKQCGNWNRALDIVLDEAA
jgi:hypothetical protein